MGKHQAYDLKQMQSLPLEAKIALTESRIRDWYDHFDGEIYVSFSGGKDSTVLKHIVDRMYNDVTAVFVNTGLEYPETQRFVQDIKAGKYPCYNPNVEILRPEMRFDEVLKKYGYPVVSKEVADAVGECQRNNGKNTVRLRKLRGELLDKNGKPSKYNHAKWKFLLEADFPISGKCCDVMKKKPAKQYEKRTGRKPILGTMATESRLRLTKWLQHGCNAFESLRQTSQPLSFWTEQDVLQYLKEFDVPYSPVYGDIVDTSEGLKTTGCDRTGCVFCGFGCHLDKGENRFQRLKKTHPRQYDYCINGGETVDGKWIPSKEGLGLGRVLDFLGVKYE